MCMYMCVCVYSPPPQALQPQPPSTPPRTAVVSPPSEPQVNRIYIYKEI